MAQFIGTIKEFNDYIGGYMTRKAQFISRKHKQKIRKCEACDSRTTILDAVHVHRIESSKTIEKILQRYSEKGLVNINLHTFEKQYLASLEPIENFIKVLCNPCHSEYANANIDRDSEKIKAIQDIKNILSSTRLSKKQAIELLRANGVDNLFDFNTHYSHFNKGINAYWLEPDNNKFSEDYNFILNDTISRKLNLFTIRANSIKSPKLIFDQRIETNSSKIIIDATNDIFRDKRGLEFNQFLVKSINYKLPNQN